MALHIIGTGKKHQKQVYKKMLTWEVFAAQMINKELKLTIKITNMDLCFP